MKSDLFIEATEIVDNDTLSENTLITRKALLRKLKEFAEAAVDDLWQLGIELEKYFSNLKL